MKAIIYCRVSTKEQADRGYSLEAQEKDCRKFALNNGYEIDKVFIERGESAKTQNRTELLKLIKYSIEHRKSLNAFIIWKYDRLARNLSDQTELIKRFSSFGIRVLSATENNEDNSVGRLMRNIFGSFAQFENDVKSERTITGMREAISQGRWCWRAPIGYKQVIGTNGKTILTPDENSQYIKNAFDLFETGLYKQVEISERLKKMGFKRATKSLVNRILKNSLYAGLIKVEWFPDFIDAVHKPIITKDSFFKTKMLLEGKRPSITPRVRNNPHFPLRNFVRCHICGQKITGGFSTGRKKIKYPYYHCPKKCSLRNIDKGVLETKFYEYIQSIQPKKELLDLFRVIVIDAWETIQNEKIKQEHRIETELKAFETKKNRIDDLMIDGKFDDETYKRKSAEVNNEILVKKVELDEMRIDLGDVEACVNYARFFIGNASRLWASSELDLKQRFQQFIFPEGITFDGEKFRTTRISIVFEWLRKENIEKLEKVSPRGFEPLPRA